MSTLVHPFAVLPVILCLSVDVSADPPPLAAGDAYTGLTNGIPTPRENDDPHPGIIDIINLLKGFEPGEEGFLTAIDDVDRYFVERDGAWRDLDGTVVFLGLSARSRNILGVYSDLGAGRQRARLLGPHWGFGLAGRGTPDVPFPAAQLGLTSGDAFGWYLEADRRVTYYSEERLNPGGWDHLFSYAIGAVSTWVRYADGRVTDLVLEDAHVLAWEDKPWDGTALGDEDYDDMLYLVGRVITSAALGEPGTPSRADADEG